MPSEPDPLLNDLDASHMREALRLAKLGEGSAEPNPMVGCVIVRDGEVVGKGYHHKFGGPHAEIDALQSMSDKTQAKGGTAYVTLEPCCHHGKTGPCADALIEAGVTRVVVALDDPFPKVDGGGLKRLRDAGIEVSVGLMQAESEQICAPYLKRTRTGLPWVIAKWAMTIDGKIATVGGDSQWISNEKSRQEVHRLRSRVDAIAVGMGTVEKDDPMLNARSTDGDLQRIASRVVFCMHRLPAVDSKLVKTARQIPVRLIVGNEVNENELTALRSAGCGVVETEKSKSADVVMAGLKSLGDEGCTNLMLEGGSQLLGSFLTTEQIDECHVYVGAKAFGGESAPGPIGGPGVASIADSQHMQLSEVRQFDDDILAIYRRG